MNTNKSILEKNIRELSGSAEKLVYLYIYYIVQIRSEDGNRTMNFNSGQISKELNMDKANVYRIMYKLAEKGVIETNRIEKNFEVRV